MDKYKIARIMAVVAAIMAVAAIILRIMAAASQDDRGETLGPPMSELDEPAQYDDSMMDDMDDDMDDDYRW